MITRLYVNNFRSLVAFEAHFDSFGVLCGPNGYGKSSADQPLGHVLTARSGTHTKRLLVRVSDGLLRLTVSRRRTLPVRPRYAFG
jgi:predicted ATPase